MKIPHKHAELIKAWADGAEIEVKGQSEEKWYPSIPDWCKTLEYRIKPEPKPEVVLHACAYFQASSGIYYMSSKLTEAVTSEDNLKITFDGETNKLIKAEVI